MQDSLNAFNAAIDETLCIDCNACHKICQYNNNVEMAKPIKWYQGWAANDGERKSSSSGGLGVSLAKTFLEKYGCVCACVFKNGEFRFEFSDSQNDIVKFSGSKYVKSDPTGIYKQIQAKLRLGENVLFIGLPCQVAAVRLYMGAKYNDNLYTVDLICHGSPSPALLEMFLKDYQVSLKTVNDIQFRRKNNFHVYNGDKGIGSEKVQDLYTFAFLSCLDYTENCYVCKYARLYRVSDITIGDSWGSELAGEEQKKGISLILCQTLKGKQLLYDTNLHLEDVDLNKAIEANHQLKEPSQMPDERNKFFFEILSSNNFKKAIKNCYSKVYYKKQLKLLLAKIGVI
jgi:coenzyme F420-reducing hydrogenase beta subunit